MSIKYVDLALSNDKNVISLSTFDGYSIEAARNCFISLTISHPEENRLSNAFLKMQIDVDGYDSYVRSTDGQYAYVKEANGTTNYRLLSSLTNDENVLVETNGIYSFKKYTVSLTNLCKYAIGHIPYYYERILSVMCQENNTIPSIMFTNGYGNYHLPTTYNGKKIVDYELSNSTNFSLNTNKTILYLNPDFAKSGQDSITYKFEDASSISLRIYFDENSLADLKKAQEFDSIVKNSTNTDDIGSLIDTYESFTCGQLSFVKNYNEYNALKGAFELAKKDALSSLKTSYEEKLSSPDTLIELKTDLYNAYIQAQSSIQNAHSNQDISSALENGIAEMSSAILRYVVKIDFGNNDVLYVTYSSEEFQALILSNVINDCKNKKKITSGDNSSYLYSTNDQTYQITDWFTTNNESISSSVLLYTLLEEESRILTINVQMEEISPSGTE